MKYVLLILLFSSNCYAQENFASGKIVYESISGRSTEYLEMWFTNSAYQCSRSTNAENVLRGTLKDKYESVEDSLAAVKKYELRKQMLSQMPPIQTWYGQLGQKNTYSVSTLGENQYATIDSIPFVQWEIQKDTQTVNGLLCQKATGTTAVSKTRIVAWFAPSIPTSVAPYTLRGLPGLLVEATYQSQPIALRMLSLDWPLKEKHDISMPTKINVVTLAELRVLQAKQSEEFRKMSDYYQKELKDGRKPKQESNQ